MGRGRSKRGRGGRGGGRRNNQRTPSYTSIKRENDTFERYYTDVNPLVPGNEMDEFWNTMKTDLPNSFRFTGSKGHALVARENMKQVYFPKIRAVQFDGQDVDPPREVAWYPEGLAYSMSTPKNVTRRFPPLADFQKFLVNETSIGNISRQEVVSMIPPLFIDIKPWMTVLDLCAAPGSKTAQLIELLHAGEEIAVRNAARRKMNADLGPDGMELELEKQDSEALAASDEDDGRCTGLVIANDVDYRRAHMLIHQTKRLNSPNLIVTNHDATLFPSIELEPAEGQSTKILKFDRILADVPCSGDGTCRKNLGVWKDWRAGNAIGLHVLQARILVRALQMLKVGGRVVYSTCSLNPLENEAVVASAIERCGGTSKVRIVDCSAQISGLHRRLGLTRWKAMDKSGRIWNSWKEIEGAMANDETGLERFVEGMFPPSTSDEEKPDLSHCMRVYPHDQDTGGFFITVLEKVSEIKAKPEVAPKNVPKPSLVKDSENGGAQDTSNGKRKIEEDDHLSPPKRTKTDDAAENSQQTDPVAIESNETAVPEAIGATENGDDGVDSIGEETATIPDGNKKDSETSKKIKCDTTITINVEDSMDSNVEPARMTSSVSGHRAATLDSDVEMDDSPYDASANTKTDRLGRDMGLRDIQLKKSNFSPDETFTYIDPTHQEIQDIMEFYVANNFPRHRFLSRNPTGEPGKAMYYTSELVREILNRNHNKGLKFVHAGVRMFVKQDVSRENVIPWRVQSDGLSIFEPWVEKNRVIHLYSRKTLHTLLKEMFPLVDRDGWKALGEIGEQVLNISPGCCILRIEPNAEYGEDGFQNRMVMPLWRGKSSVNLMLPKEERKALLVRLFDDKEDLVDYSRTPRTDKDEQNGEVKEVKEVEKANDIAEVMAVEEA